ncbi:calcium/calmodulin-dependent 3',5'-cyclic nucleotide phosphodiesterase 1A isoform X3 [Lingula anatina]|uniref:Phosphodiesterase n=1 Tax=Lingula anatina TaxID=7574 RepID=A0A1S3IJM2_LINAN|nr:calcium/calmodulin-dependent 3',5'-cyclic nucleotide phosphodiesterase 1A isoform X3 [Lingula anatina]|eukprot:XP_013397704.1 calcium/calmodulin-dependent 3',5'-cyclic nucleotide phosphodiesterase 1A isoform X3 [Lingula anatina]
MKNNMSKSPPNSGGFLPPSPRRPLSAAKSDTSSLVNRRGCIVHVDGLRYTIVANPPEKSKDDSSISAKNGQLSKTGTNYLTRHTQKSPSALENRTPSPSGGSRTPPSGVGQDYAVMDLSTDNMPAIDTPEASHLCSRRLRHILKKLDHEELSKEDLKRNLEYAASVLETVYIDETRRLCDEDDELSEVEPDAVPSEVRDWLALTFTRSMSSSGRKLREEKPKFRTVAHAIRAGIMVDKIYRRMSASLGMQVPPTVSTMLKNINEWSFDVFAVNDISEGHALKYVAYDLLQRYDLIAKFKINITYLENFLHTMEQGYSKNHNPYHNLTHAADVAQTVHHIMSQSRLVDWLTDLDILATIIAACIHDFEHTGTTNNFHVMTGSDYAMLYNDRAVLENHHVSSAFRLLKQEENNVLSNLSKEDFRYFRSLVIDMVLATDMSFHFQQIKNMKNLLSMPENIDKPKALSLLLHCADISHPAKDWTLHHRWTMLLLEEFFQQGDREKQLGLPCSPLCDRENTLVAESQIGFINIIVDPSFTVMGDMLEKVVTKQMTGQSPKNSISEEEDKKSRRGSSISGGSRSGERPPSIGSTRRSLSLSGTVKYELKRSWEQPLAENLRRWKEESVKNGEKKPSVDGRNSRQNSSSDLSANTHKNSRDESDSPSNQNTGDEIQIKPLQKGVSRQTSTSTLLAYTKKHHQPPSKLTEEEDSQQGLL